MPGEATQTRLVEASDSDFVAMARKDTRLPGGLTLPPEGVELPAVLERIRVVALRLREGGSGATWMIVAGETVVGLIGHKGLPVRGVVEIGYGVAASYRERGHATRAVAAVLSAARTDPAVNVIEATTTFANIASHRVLEKNGFTRAGRRYDPDDGELILWRRSVAPENL